MSQQFLSKYFKRPRDNNDEAEDTCETQQRFARCHSDRGGVQARGGSRGRGQAATPATKHKEIDPSSRAVRAGTIACTQSHVEWQCPKCTFKNTGEGGAACGMCGQRRAATAPQEIEILTSDSETGTAKKGDIVGDKTSRDDDDDSDFEDSSSAPRRKRSKNGNGKDEEPHEKGTKKRLPGSSASGSSQRSPDNTDNGTSSREDAPPVDYASVGQTPSGNLSVFGSRATASTSSGAVICASDFDLQEDMKRRNDFQAGLKAALRDDEPPADGAEAGHGSGGDRKNGAGANASGGGVGAEKSFITTSAWPGKGKGAVTRAKLTPMEQQVVDLKVKHPGVLLLVECGYRYRFFGEDALVAAKVLRIYAHMDHNFQVASVPTFRLPVHLRRLVDAGYKVGIVRQAESAVLKAAGLTVTGKKSGTFARELVAVFSQATWVEGVVETLMPVTSGSGGGGDSGTGKSAGQGSFRKIGGAWRRVAGWGAKGGKWDGGSAGNGEMGVAEGKEEEGEAASEADLDAPFPQADHERSEQWLMSIYEEDASAGAPSGGEPLSISIALNGGSGGSEKETEKVRVGLVGVDVRTGKVVHDTFEEDSGQRQELHTRLRHLRPLELLVPAPRLSKATEAALAMYCESAVDSMGAKRWIRTERFPPEEFCFEAAQASLSKYYSKGQQTKAQSREGGGGGVGTDGVPVLTRVLDLARPAVCALGPLMTHLERYGIDRALASPELVSFSQSRYMTLDAVTLRDLEVLQCQVDGREAGSLFSLLDCTQTAFGRRVLAGWVRQPLLSIEDITARQDAVEELATDAPSVTERLRPLLRDLKDLDPAIASLHHRRIQPSRLLSLFGTMRKVLAVFYPLATRAAGVNGTGASRDSPRSAVLLDVIAGVPATLAPVVAGYLGELDATAAAADNYVRALVNGESLCKALAEAREDEESAKDGLEKELASVRAALRKPSLQWKTLRTGATSTVEYLVELRKSETKQVPSSWMQVSQTKDLARFHTPEVLQLQQELLMASESRNIAARQAWAQFVAQADEECYDGFRSVMQALGTLDALLSLSAVAMLPGYVRPRYRPTGGAGAGADATPRDNVDEMVLRGARHPTVERVLEGGFVPNDINLRRGECLVVTGPNMGGKSSTVRMAALICIMGQMGSFVPADSAKLYCLDGVYTRMGAGDDLAADMSTFMVELWHTSCIIKHATDRSLVVLDELGRGTSTHDGVAIALATLRHLVRDVGCATLFVTHYPQVADMASDKSLSGRVKNAHMSFIEEPAAAAMEETARNRQVIDTSGGEDGGEGAKHDRKAESCGVTFLYRLVVGQAHKSYGLNVARAAGMDEDLINLAARKSAEMRDRSH